MRFKLSLYFIFFFIFMNLCQGLSMMAFASQGGEILADEATIYSQPALNSKKLSKLNKGTEVKVSTRAVRDTEGSRWYKIRLASGESGFIQASDVMPRLLKHDLKAAGISKLVDEDDEDGGGLPWFFLLRAMVIGGAYGGQFEFAGEGEASVCVPLRLHGYLHRVLSLGIVYIPLKEDKYMAGSLIFRMFEKTRIEPELRIRVGKGSQTSQWVLGVNAGVNYPLALNYRSYFAAYGEGGSLFGLQDSSIVHLWAAGGIGFHF